MSTPIIETIAENVKTTLAGVTTANGYNQTLSVTRPKRIDYLNAAWGDLSVVITQAGAARATDSTNMMEWQQTFEVIAFVIDSDDETASVDTRKNQVAADMIKALMVDHTRGSYAIDTDITGIEMFEDEEGSAGGVVLEVEVHYRTTYTNPYTQ